MKVGFIGAGKVGFSLGKYFKTHGVSVVGYYSKTPESANQQQILQEQKSMALLRILCGIVTPFLLQYRMDKFVWFGIA